MLKTVILQSNAKIYRFSEKKKKIKRENIGFRHTAHELKNIRDSLVHETWANRKYEKSKCGSLFINGRSSYEPNKILASHSNRLELERNARASVFDLDDLKASGFSNNRFVSSVRINQDPINVKSL